MSLPALANDDYCQPINLFEYEQLAKKHLSQMAFDYYSSGAGDEITLRDNRTAFERIKLRPRILVDVSDRYLSTSILGQPLPLVIKGILRGDDAVRAVEYGAKAIVVSNHGGRQLDGAIASLDALTEIVAAVDGRVEVLLDGGIRRGTDILKALAIGAKALMIGRPILWGLAVGGQAGVSHVISLLQNELNVAMALSGCTQLQNVDSSLVTLN
ncbi:MAG: alpha-hydroxy-acid oxidizing protein [Trichormus sp. ATA11-4-KO1]|nr:alpha-hydroxy-acid oxidizing protein [Trichormus sp. ATA11-4-KO1]